jgi:OOP family OmpA-OmpF porin
MNLHSNLAVFALVSGNLLLAPLVLADEFRADPAWSNTAWYWGGGIGRSKARVDETRIVNALTAAGATSVTINSDERDTGYKLYIGKQLNQNFALEGGWFDLGKFGFDARTLPLGTLTGRDSVRGLNFDLLLQLPLSERVSLLGRLGSVYARGNTRFGGDQVQVITDPHSDERGFRPKAGLGLEYKFTEALALRGEAERYRINDPVRNRRDIDFYSINLVYKFGRPASRAVAQAEPTPDVMPISETRPSPAPAPVQVAAAPVVAKPQPVSEKVTFSAETLFDFDKAVVKPEGKTALDELLVKLQGMNTEVMVTVGHTDSVGSDDYNQKLSTRRAEAVKAYLQSKGVEAGRVFTEGKGESQPLVDNKTATNRAQNRRVTVEVVGTRTVAN